MYTAKDCKSICLDSMAEAERRREKLGSNAETFAFLHT